MIPVIHKFRIHAKITEITKLLEDKTMTFEKVRAILADHIGEEEDTITMESVIRELGIDSLDTVEILMDIEDEFGVEIKPEEIGETVGDLVKLIEAGAAE